MDCVSYYYAARAGKDGGSLTLADPEVPYGEKPDFKNPIRIDSIKDISSSPLIYQITGQMVYQDVVRSFVQVLVFEKKEGPAGDRWTLIKDCFYWPRPKHIPFTTQQSQTPQQQQQTQQQTQSQQTQQTQGKSFQRKPKTSNGSNSGPKGKDKV